MISVGIHAVVAAGNYDADAITYSPARVLAANTIGASNIHDSRSYFSNFGSVVDVFAPGSHIISASNKSDTGLAVMDGTSMATPHVTGTAAYIISVLPKKPTPAQLQRLIRDRLAVKDKLSNVPTRTRNLLLQCP